MKKALLYSGIVIVFFLTGSFLHSQQRINERQAIDKSHINFATQYLYFVVSDTIEIDGHDFTHNKTIIYTADADKVQFIDTVTHQTYVRRKCEQFGKGCRKLHLEKVQSIIIPQYKIPWQIETVPLDHMNITPVRIEDQLKLEVEDSHPLHNLKLEYLK
jgi:hypothetical protein